MINRVLLKRALPFMQVRYFSQNFSGDLFSDFSSMFKEKEGSEEEEWGWGGDSADRMNWSDDDYDL